MSRIPTKLSGETKLSPNFRLREFLKSSTADRHGIDNTPTDEEVERMKKLCVHVLEPIRAKFGMTKISSGLRVIALNRKVGSDDTSDHIMGYAVDFECPLASNDEVAKWISENLVFCQLIREFAVDGEPMSGWIHVSYNEADNKCQVLTIKRVNGKVVTRVGL